MSKKIVSIILCLLMCFPVLAGCGRGNDSTPNGKVSIVVADKVDYTNGINAWMKIKQDEFDEAYPNIEVKHISDPLLGTDRIMEQFVNTMTPDNAPTVVKMSGVSNIRTARDTNLIQDWNTYVSDWSDLQEMDESLIQALSIDDKLVGIPTSIEVPLLAFNRRLMEEADVTEAEVLAIETWEDYKEVGKKLSNPNKNISGIGLWMTNYNLGLEIWNASNTFNLATQNADGTISLDYTNETTLETIEFMRSLVEEGITVADPNLSQTQYFNEVLSDRIASFVYYTSWSSGWFTPGGLGPNDIVCIPFPKGPSSEKRESIVAAIGYLLSAKATPEQAEAAATYVKFMQSMDAWAERYIFAEEEGIDDLVLPPYPDVDASSVYDGIPSSWATALDYARNNLTVIDINSMAFTTSLTKLAPSLLDKEQYPDMVSVEKALSDLQATETAEWLNGYNEQHKK